MFKERGKLEGALIWLGSWVAAFAIGGIVAQVIIKWSIVLISSVLNVGMKM